MQEQAAGPSGAGDELQDVRAVQRGAFLYPPVGKEVLPHVALLWYPGSGCSIQGYINFAKKTQACLHGHVQLWVYISTATDDGNLLPGEGIVQVVAALMKKGFKPRRSTPTSIRFSNVVVGGHCDGAVAAEMAATPRGSALIIVGASLCVSSKVTAVRSFAQYPLPILCIVGELDGQFRWTTIAGEIVQLLQEAIRVDVKFAVTNKYAAIVPGMNHMQIADGLPKYARGDLDAEAPFEVVITKLSNLASAFIQANYGTKNTDSMQYLAGFFFNETLRVAGPYLTSCGFHNIDLMTSTVAKGGKLPPNNANIVYDAARGEMIGTSFAARSQVAHPGEMDMARVSCIAAQRGVLHSNVTASIAPQVTTDMEMFTLTSARIVGSRKDRVVLVPCCYIHRPALGSSDSTVVTAKGTGPEYWMKLVPQATVSAKVGTEGVFVVTSPSSRFNEITFQKATDAASFEAIERYNRRGAQMNFVDDEDTSGWQYSWPKGKRGITFRTDFAARSTMIQGQSSVTNNEICMQVLSPARALEYIMIDALRTQPSTV